MLCLFSGAVEAGIAHGLKKRAAGLLPPQDTQSLLLKLTRLSEPAAELVKKLSGDDEANKDGSRNFSPGNYKLLGADVVGVDLVASHLLLVKPKMKKDCEHFGRNTV